MTTYLLPLNFIDICIPTGTDMFLAAIAFAARGELTGERPAGLSQLASLGVYALMVLVIRSPDVPHYVAGRQKAQP